MSTGKNAALSIGLAGVCLAGAVVDPAAAQATPPSGISAKLISEVTIGGTEFVLREITIAPGGSTGSHYHDGTVFGWMKSGVLTHVDADCTVTTYGPGQTIVEPSGRDKAHLGRNDGTTPVVLNALYILPAGAPFAEDAPDLGCPH